MTIEKIPYDFSVCKVTDYSQTDLETGFCFIGKTDEEKSLLNEQLLQIAQNIARHPEVTLTCFVPDRRKSGGSYVCISNHVKKIDTYKRCLILSDENNRNENYEISFDNILEIKEIKDI